MPAVPVSKCRMNDLFRRSFLFFVCALVCKAQTSPPSFAERLVEAALERVQHTVRYDPAYVVLDYPDGDVPADTGVCTDEVIRSYRALGIDLQKLVHEACFWCVSEAVGTELNGQKN